MKRDVPPHREGLLCAEPLLYYGGPLPSEPPPRPQPPTKKQIRRMERKARLRQFIAKEGRSPYYSRG